MRVYAMLCLLMTSLLLAGCPTLAPPVPVDEGVDESRALTEIVLYAQRAAQMSAEEQKRELANWTQAIAKEKGDRQTIARIRAALLLSLPGSSVQDDARAQNVLEPYANVAANTGALRQFAAFLHDQIAERVRMGRRADQLKEQLDALRAVERSIIERGQKPPPRKP